MPVMKKDLPDAEAGLIVLQFYRLTQGAQQFCSFFPVRLARNPVA